MSLIIGQIGTSFVLAVGVHAGIVTPNDGLLHYQKEREVTSAVQITQPKPVSYYRIQQGDTLSKIALDYGTTVDHLKEINSLTDSTIVAGKRLAVDTARVRTSPKPSVRKEIKKTNSNKQGKVVMMSVSAYTPQGGSNGGRVTASGTTPTEGRTIAMGRAYPFGTKVKILGHIYTVEDRGGAIGNKSVDLFMNSQSKAIQFGRKYIPVEILD